MIQGISHITFIVKDIEKTAGLLKSIFDAKEVYSSGSDIHSISKEKFLTINDIWFAIMEGNSLVEKTYNHIAFQVSADDFDVCRKKIIELDLEIPKDRNRVPGEGKSLYFYDYDNHLFELHTGSLEERLKSYSENPA